MTDEEALSESYEGDITIHMEGEEIGPIFGPSDVVEVEASESFNRVRLSLPEISDDRFGSVDLVLSPETAVELGDLLKDVGRTADRLRRESEVGQGEDGGDDDV